MRLLNFAIGRRVSLQKFRSLGTDELKCFNSDTSTSTTYSSASFVRTQIPRKVTGTGNLDSVDGVARLSRATSGFSWLSQCGERERDWREKVETMRHVEEIGFFVRTTRRRKKNNRLKAAFKSWLLSLSLLISSQFIPVLDSYAQVVCSLSNIDKQTAGEQTFEYSQIQCRFERFAIGWRE